MNIFPRTVIISDYIQLYTILAYSVKVIKLTRFMGELHNIQLNIDDVWQVSYYQEYVKACVNNLSKAKKSNKGDKRQTAKYSAQKLYEKGVLVEIEKVPTSSFKAVTIEFSSTEQVGVFEVSGKLSGMNIDKINVVFENLLQVLSLCSCFDGNIVYDIVSKCSRSQYRSSPTP